MASSDSNSPDSIWQYSPSFPLAVLATVLFGLSCIAISYLTLIKHRAYFFICVISGAAVETLGYALRSASAKQQSQLTLYVMTLSLVVLAPVFIAAGNYLLIGRLIQAVLPQHQHRIFGLHGRLLTRVFVGCDILTFLIQASGSGIASSGNWKGDYAKIGTDVLIAGLGFQVATFVVFLAVFIRFHQLARRSAVETAPRHWQKLVVAVYISSFLILLRCVYRVAEFSNGIESYLFNHEWAFWVFETLPMVCAISVFILRHPSKYLASDRKGSHCDGGC